ncbi:MAG: matrixin family metalloprotease [bacterium]
MNRTALALALTLTAGAASAYERSTTSRGAPLEWNQRVIHFALNAAGSDDIELAALEAEVQRAFAPWAEHTCAIIEFPYDGLTDAGADLDDIGFDLEGPNENVVVFREEREDWRVIDAATGRPRESTIIAVTTVTFCEEKGGQCDLPGEILDADIEVNGAFFRFSIDQTPPANRFDLRNTLTHEVGHLLGFDHTPDTEATMFASAPVGETKKRSLEEDDIAALCDVYARIYDERKGSDDDCRAAPGADGSPAPALLLLAGLAWRSRRRRLTADRS